MIALLFPASKKRNEQGKKCTEANTIFQSIFRGNNATLRSIFFKDPLVKHLWGTIFIVECDEVIRQYLRKVRGYPE